MTRIGVPRRHIGNFGVLRESFALSEAGKWPVIGFLVLCGKNGTGKSFAAARVVYEYLEGRVTDRLDRGTWATAERAGDSVTWLSAKEIIDDADARERARGSYLLVMDDLGREDETKTARAVLCSVISRRYDAKLATVITTELSMTDVRKRYGRYLTDRLAEDVGNGGGVIDCGDISMRLEMAWERRMGG
jgi:DNA replication protein DnaC